MDPTDLRAGLADRLAGDEPIDAETFNAVCFMLSRALDQVALAVPEAAPLARRLLRVAGRIVIDTGLPGASAQVWPNTEEMALLWIDEALAIRFARCRTAGIALQVPPGPGGWPVPLDRRPREPLPSEREPQRVA